MTVNELVQELQWLDRPDLDVFIPCPHCCGQRDTDFDLLDGTRQDCLGDRRSDSRLRVRKAATGHAPAIAAGLGCSTCGPSRARTLSECIRTSGKDTISPGAGPAVSSGPTW